MAEESRLMKLKKFDQSIWLDYIERRILEDGTLARMIADDGIAGMTSNPTIFEKAITHTDDYHKAIFEMGRRGADTEEIYERLVIYDVKKAADVFRPVYDATGGRDGFVSLEVSPHLAYETDATIAEARRLWRLLERPNVMIKVPGTRAGLPAVRALIRDGVNVNVTLLFSVGRYVEVIEAYTAGLSERAAAGEALDSVASVASFFVSRIDSAVDTRLVALAADHPEADRLRGRIAVASAGFAYRRFEEYYATPRWQTLAHQGARPQRLLWASTGTKDPDYSDVKYVEALIGPQTVNTVPMKTLDAYRDHGDPAPRLHDAVREAPELIQQLNELGLDLREVDEQLEAEGVQKFIKPFDALHHTLAQMKNRPPDSLHGNG